MKPRRGLAFAVVAIGLAVVAVPPVRDWLLRPWDGADDHRLTSWVAWHGRLMVAGWAILIPLGTIAARYFKIWPGQNWPDRLDDKRWWHAHRLLQCGGIAAATGGLWLAWRNAGGGPGLAHWHAILGWTIMLLGWMQIAGGMLRGSKGGPTDPRAGARDFHGDHYAMTPRRILFERLHKSGGYAALALTVVVVPMGLTLADAPRWMWLVIALWWMLLAGAAWRFQRAGRCVDTYQAIWGPAANLPGGRLRPIGWGISRRKIPSDVGGGVS